MVGYFMLFVLIFLSFSVKRKKEKVLFAFTVLTFFSALRYGIGMDYYTYWDFASNYEAGVMRFEPIPRFLCYLSSSIHCPELFFVITSIIIALFFAIPIYKLSSSIEVSILFYICFPFFFMDHLGIIRQGMACAIIFYAMTVWRERRVVQLCLIVLASLCHRSALLSVMILFPWHIFNKKVLCLLFLASILFGSFILSNFTDYILSTSIFLSDDYANYLDKNSLNEGQKIKYLVYLIGVLLMLSYDKICTISSHSKYLVSLTMVGICIYAILIGVSSSMAKRLSMFFFCPIIIIIPDIIRCLKIPRKAFYAAMISLFVALLAVDASNKNARIEDNGMFSSKYPYRTIINK